MKRTKPNLATFLNLPNPGLRAYFSHVVEGQPEDYRPPFWKGLSRETVLNRWQEKLDALRVNERVPGLAEFETEMRTKVGPLSVQLPLRERLESIEHYYTLVNTKSVPIDPRAIEATWKTFSKAGGVRLKSIRNVSQAMRLNTNSGTPYFTKRRVVLKDTLRDIKEWDPSVLGDWRMSAILGWRGQEGGPEKDDVKQRVVWMMPLSVNMIEATFYQPAIAAWQKYNINSAYVSMRAVEEKITRLFDSKGDEYVVVTDFSKFDQHFNSDLQNASGLLIQSMIDGRLAHDVATDFTHQYLIDVFPYKYEVPLICSSDVMYSGKHGMASGSTGTNFDECCAHTAMQHECAILNGATLNPYSNAYGDDGYLSFKGIDVDKVISAYTSHGQEMNPSKQSVDKHSAVYLRRYFHDSYRDSSGKMLGIYSTFRALGRLLGQERYFNEDEVMDDYKSLVILRAFSILENCANHPLFHEFVDFCVSGDKYRLGLAIPGFFDGLGKKAKKFMDVTPDILGYTKTLQSDDFRGIERWEVVKYLKEKVRK
nr:RNA-dependent RNA polymerase [Marmot picobirnavirus]